LIGEVRARPAVSTVRYVSGEALSSQRSPIRSAPACGAGLLRASRPADDERAEAGQHLWALSPHPVNQLPEQP